MPVLKYKARIYVEGIPDDDDQSIRRGDIVTHEISMERVNKLEIKDKDTVIAHSERYFHDKEEKWYWMIMDKAN